MIPEVIMISVIIGTGPYDILVVAFIMILFVDAFMIGDPAAGAFISTPKPISQPGYWAPIYTLNKFAGLRSGFF
jgi:hypothetical protein